MRQERVAGVDNGSNLDDLTALPLADVIIWSYRLFLGRNPENMEIVSRHLAAAQSFEDVRQGFLKSPEFQARQSPPAVVGLSRRLLEIFPPYTGPGEAGFLTDFIGTRSRCAFFPTSYAGASGIVEGPPGTERFGLHEVAEWEGALRSVSEASGRFVAVELGAGWGPWLVASAVAAQRRGIKDIHLAGVEGSLAHYEFMQQHFRDNGLEPSAHLLLHAVAGENDGTAWFPKLDVPSDHWGAQAEYEKATMPAQFEEVESISLKTLLSRLPPVDLLHCDIQGAELTVLPAALDMLSDRVRRIVVGTHGRSIEEQLMQAFGTAHWTLEHEQACGIGQTDTGKIVARKDGVQVWRNNRKAA